MVNNNVQAQYRRCGSTVLHTINAPLPLVWSLVREFDKPHVFMKLAQTCTLISGSGEIGSVRQINFRSGLPGRTSIEKLEKLDEEHHTMVYRVIGGDHKLVNLHVTTSLHEVIENVNGNGCGDGYKKTLVIDSYTVDVPDDSNEEDTCYFTNTISQLNLKNLGTIVEGMAKWCSV